MNEIQRPVNLYNAYHAHVYFDETSKDIAKKLCEDSGTKFDVKVGRFHEKLVGPHPRWSCQIAFAKKDFDSLIPWLEENRKSLTILVHALTGDDLKDHTEYAYWLGQAVELNLGLFTKNNEGAYTKE